MKVIKKISVSGEFAKVGVDIKEGSIITILDGGTEITSQFGPQIVYKIKTQNGEKILGFNQTSTNALIDAFGDETEGWVGKVVTASVIKALVSGAMKNVVYLVPEGFEVNEQGKIVKSNGDTPSNKESIIQLDDDIDPKDIPF